MVHKAILSGKKKVKYNHHLMHLVIDAHQKLYKLSDTKHKLGRGSLNTTAGFFLQKIAWKQKDKALSNEVFSACDTEGHHSNACKTSQQILLQSVALL